MEQDPFDVVLLDMRMPGQDGLSVLRTIKQKWPESEVVIITGYPTVDSAKEAVRLGAYDYVAKPVGPQDVINVTDGAMTRKQWALRRVPEESAPARPEKQRPHQFKQQTQQQQKIRKGEGHERITQSTRRRRRSRPSARASTGFFPARVTPSSPPKTGKRRCAS